MRSFPETYNDPKPFRLNDTWKVTDHLAVLRLLRRLLIHSVLCQLFCFAQEDHAIYHLYWKLQYVHYVINCADFTSET